MFPLIGQVRSLVFSAVARLPISAYWRTRLWATSLAKPIGHMADWPYYRGIELALRALSYGYGGFRFPEAKSYTLLEFGVANGNTLRKMLHFRDVWRRRMKINTHITVMGFDTFAGLPAPRAGDEHQPYQEGDYAGSMEEVAAYLERCFTDFRLVRGEFKQTLAAETPFLVENPPLFVSVDCDYYSSTVDIFDALLPKLAPHGCMFYFDDVMAQFWTNLTGELRAIREANCGQWGGGIELVEYPLYIETGELRHYRQLYRLFRLATATEQARQTRAPDTAPTRHGVTLP